MAAYCLVSYVTCRLTAKNRDQLRNPTLGNGVWAAFTFTSSYGPWWHCFRFFRPTVWRQICCVLVAVGQRHLPAGLSATSSLCFVFLFLFVLLVSRVVNNRAVNWLGARLIAMPNVLDNSYVICKVSAWNMNLSERDDVQCAQFRLILCSLLYHLASVWYQSITVPWTKYSEIGLNWMWFECHWIQHLYTGFCWCPWAFSVKVKWRWKFQQLSLCFYRKLTLLEFWRIIFAYCIFSSRLDGCKYDVLLIFRPKEFVVIKYTHIIESV